MLITSLNNNHVKELVKLKEKKYRDETNSFLVEGEHLVLEAYRAGLIKELILEENTLFPINVMNITYVTKDIIKKISSNPSPSNIMAVVNKKEETSIGEKLLILEDIQDPGNFGAIIRSALAFGIDTIVISPKTVDLYNPKVVRSTQGMMFHINIIVRQLVPFINELKKENYKILGTKVTNGHNVKESKTYSHYALIIGNEGNGMSEEVSNLCDEYLYIRMNEQVESLNAAVATSILLYELYNK